MFKTAVPHPFEHFRLKFLICFEFRISFASQTGKNYTLEYKSSLVGTNWTALSPSSGTGGLITLSDSLALGAARFYQVRQD